MILHKLHKVTLLELDTPHQNQERKYENDAIEEIFERPHRNTLKSQNREPGLSGSHIHSGVNKELTEPDILHRNCTKTKFPLFVPHTIIIADKDDDSAEKVK